MQSFVCGISVEDQEKINFVSGLLKAVSEVFRETPKCDQLRKDVDFLLSDLSYFVEKYPPRYGQF